MKTFKGYQESKHIQIERFINGSKNSCMGSKNTPCDLTAVNVIASALSHKPLVIYHDVICLLQSLVPNVCP